MKRKKILWLVSWYPNGKDAFDGDFIQRHARAAAIFHDIHVLFVTPAPKGQETREEIHRATGLTEQIIYYRSQDNLISKLTNHFQWKKISILAAEKYIERNGRPDLIHVHVPWKAGIIALHFKNNFSLPYIITEHWGIYNDKVEDNFNNQPFYVRRYLRRIYMEADNIVTVSQYAGEGIKKYFPLKKYEVIPNVVDSTLFHAAKEKYSKFSFIHVSNMVPLKNVDAILEAFRLFLQESGVQAQLIMVGDRDDHYRKKAESMGLLNSGIFFRGEISYREVAEEMGRCHCLVIYSATETFSCVTAEALCSGIPVIASRAGALPELVNSENGLLVPESDVDKLKEAMKTMFSNIKAYRADFIAASSRQLYNYPAVAEQFSRLYENGSLS